MVRLRPINLCFIFKVIAPVELAAAQRELFLGRIGPGKIALLEAIRKTGSITAAAQSMQMSYRRAWLLVDELNKLMSEPVVTTTAGGAMHGGTTLTPVGEKTIALYHSIEAHTRAAARSDGPWKHQSA